MRIGRRLIGITGLRDVIERRIPVLTLDSRAAGPTVWLTACIHGDEVGGAAIVHDVFAQLRDAGLLRGKLHGLPLINSMGFENLSRYINAEREDLNRCFPGDANGSMGERIAHRLFETIVQTSPALVIDLHNDWIHSVPYLLVEPPALYASQGLEKTTLSLARATGQLLVQDSPDTPSLRRTLSAALVAAGTPSFTLEAGGAGGIVEEGVSAGKLAVLGALASLDMCAAPPAAADRAEGELLVYTNQPLSTTSGFVRFAVAPGDRVSAQQTVARVYSAFGSCEETLRAARPGHVLGLADHARTTPGCEVIAIAADPLPNAAAS